MALLNLWFTSECSLLSLELLFQECLARRGGAEDVVEAEPCVLVSLALRALVEVFLQGVRELGLVLPDDLWVVGHVAQCVVVVERLVGPCEGDAVGALVVGEGGRAVALGILCDIFLSTVFECVVVAGGEAHEGQEKRQYRFFHGLLLCLK